MPDNAPSKVAIDVAVAAIKFDANGLIPVIAQQHTTGEVLMLAWMNADAFRETLETQRLCYWSRSRQRLWRKGESSGQIQNLIDLRWDCDGDSVLAIVDQTGVACHTGRQNCFFYAIRDDSTSILMDPEIDPEDLYER